jgi:hypothetical protein
MDGANLLSTEEIIIGIYCRVDQKMAGVTKDPQAHLWPSELVTIGLLFAIKGVRGRAFYRWLWRDWRGLFPRLPERTRLFRLLAKHRAWTDRFMAEPTFFGVVDGYGIELIHPCREGRSVDQLGRKGFSNHRWIDGGKLGAVLNGRGEVVAWDAAVASAYDGKAFADMIAQFDGRMIILADNGFHQSQANGGDPPNLQLCKRKTWSERIVIETMLSMLTTVCHFKSMAHRCWRYFETHLGLAMAAFNVLINWDGLPLGDDKKYHPSIARFNL